MCEGTTATKLTGGLCTTVFIIGNVYTVKSGISSTLAFPTNA